MTIVERAKVLAAVDRALRLDAAAGGDAAIASAAQALCLPVEAVAEAVRERDAEVTS